MGMGCSAAGFGQLVTNIWDNAGLNEYFSSYDNIGHNNLVQLIFLWIIPK